MCQCVEYDLAHTVCPPNGLICLPISASPRALDRVDAEPSQGAGSQSGMRRWPEVSVLAAAFTLGVVTLVAVVHADSRSTITPPGPTSGADPEALVGAWRVGGSQVLADKRLYLSPSGRLRAVGSGCRLMGGWSATESGLTILSVEAAGGRCGDDLPDAGGIFDGVQRFTVGGPAVRLTDLIGKPVITLIRADDSVGANPSAAAFTPRPAPAALSSGLQPVSETTLATARWLPVATLDSDRWSDRERPHVSFAVGGGWSGSDGCNGLGGRWSMDPTTGEWLSGRGSQTEIGCDNVDVASMVATARTVGSDGDELVFLDPDGNETGRFVRDPSSVGSLP